MGGFLKGLQNLSAEMKSLMDQLDKVKGRGPTPADGVLRYGDLGNSAASLTPTQTSNVPNPNQAQLNETLKNLANTSEQQLQEQRKQTKQAQQNNQKEGRRLGL